MKARGDGLGYDLIKAEFHFEEGVSSNTATVWIDGVKQPRCDLPGKHPSIALYRVCTRF